MAKPNWMQKDDATNAAKTAAWRAIAGDQAPHRAWYYSFRFQDENIPASLLDAMRVVFWDADAKARVIPNVDVKVDHLSDLAGVPVLRVSMPEQFVTHFTVGAATFVLYRAMIGDEVLDFGREWGGLRGAPEGGRSATIVGNVGLLMAGDDMPPPAALLRDAERRAALPPGATIVPDSPPPVLSEVEGPAPAEPPAPAVRPESPKIVFRGKNHDGWAVFGGASVEPPAQAAPAPAALPPKPKPRPMLAPKPSPISMDGCSFITIALLAATAISVSLYLYLLLA